MIPIEIIKQKYASLSDAELCALVGESTSLSHEAFLALKRELRKRRLDGDLILVAEKQRVAEKQGRIQENLAKAYESHVQKVWLSTMEGKQRGLRDEELITQLRELGLSYEEASEVLLLLPRVVNDLFRKAGQHMKKCGLACLLGLLGLFILLPNFSSVPLSVLYLSGVLLLYGAVGFFKAERQYQQCRQVLEVLAQEGVGQV